MKGIQQRLCTVLSPSSARPRLYHTSTALPLSFFDSPQPPTPTSRLPSRIPSEPKHSQLALTLSPPPDQDLASIFYTQNAQYLSLPKYPTTISTLNSTKPTSSSRHNRIRIRYQLDVGAYGIPKRCRNHTPPQRSFQTYVPDDSSFAVSIGEDAYFIRDNAIGVADGVGGWARSSFNPPDSSFPSPSALFAHRLMHYTSDELSSPPPQDSLQESCDLNPASELESHLSDLSEGIDVLQILERAYERTVNAHVHPQSNGSTPLHTGSSTALVAVLDHVHVPPADRVSTTASESHAPSTTPPLPKLRNDPEVKLESPTSPVPVVKIAHIGDCMGMLVRGEEIVWRSEEMWWAFNTPVQLSPPPPPQPPQPSTTQPASSTTLSSLLSSTSSLLFPSPSQSPPSPKSRLYSTIPTPRRTPSPPPLITPRTTAHLITLPVHPNDILILASDGLSDNLWDEDVLDEVIRFRRTWAPSKPESIPSPDPEQAAAASLTMETSTSSTLPMPAPSPTPTTDALRRRSLAGMLSEALCSRARRVSERRASPGTKKPAVDSTEGMDHARTSAGIDIKEDEVPFARRAREVGKVFRGGKRDDISVLVAVISPTPIPTTAQP
ncbi:hypothetical protein L208DRAFT_1403405 [Tricholoma matsutake]|nr:hypothetical protein L208DRAFT_1403405 [Tricholoma matsutake 945]